MDKIAVNFALYMIINIFWKLISLRNILSLAVLTNFVEKKTSDKETYKQTK